MRLGILASGGGTNLQALIEASAASDFPGETVMALVNTPGCGAAQRAQAAGVPVTTLDHRSYPDRASFDRDMAAALRAHGVELACLAGFMRLLTGDFVQAWRDRLVNIHPSLLPAYKGLHTHRRALADGTRIHGCTVHVVRPEMDVGPIAAQAAVPVLGSDDQASLAARVGQQERRLYPWAVREMCAGRLRVDGERVVYDGETAAPPHEALFSPSS